VQGEVLQQTWPEWDSRLIEDAVSSDVKVMVRIMKLICFNEDLSVFQIVRLLINFLTSSREVGLNFKTALLPLLAFFGFLLKPLRYRVEPNKMPQESLQ